MDWYQLVTSRSIRWTLLALGLQAAACGSGPSAPSGDPGVRLGLSTDRYYFTVRAPAGLQGCASPWEPDASTSRVATIDLIRDGSSFGGRQAAGSGDDLEIAIEEFVSGGVSGTIRGTLVTVPGPGGSIALGASFGRTGGPPAFLTGHVVTGLGGALGRIEGTIVFLDATRVPMTCASADWTLIPTDF